MSRRGRLRPHGWQVKATWRYSAYLPDPLPPPIRSGSALAFRLSEADRVVGWLAGEKRRLPNPHVLIRPFVRREAVL